LIRPKPRSSKLIITGFALALLLGGSFAFLFLTGAIGRTTQTSIETSSTGPQTMFSRVVLARFYQQQDWTVPGESSSQVADAVASLRPTYVSGVLRVSSNTSLTQNMISDFNTIRSSVLGRSPMAKFDFVLNAQDYTSASQIQSKMQTINSQIHVDIWFFDYYEEGYVAHPTVMEAAVGYAHSQGQLVGGNLDSGLDLSTTSPEFPSGSDFVSVPDSNFVVSPQRLQQVRSEAPTVPILVHTNNNPQNGPTSESCVYINGFSEQQRVAYETQMAQNQTRFGYFYMYNVFFPLCPVGTSYNSLTDGSMLQIVENLLNTYG